MDAMTLARALPWWTVDDGVRVRRYRREADALQAVSVSLWGTARPAAQKRSKTLPPGWQASIIGEATRRRSEQTT